MPSFFHPARKGKRHQSVKLLSRKGLQTSLTWDGKIRGPRDAGPLCSNLRGDDSTGDGTHREQGRRDHAKQFAWARPAGLFLDLDPNAVRASVEERRLEQPDALAISAKALCAQVKVPLGACEPELISGCRGVGWRGVDRITGRHRIAVLERLKCMDARRQRRSEADRIELHRDGAIQLE